MLPILIKILNIKPIGDIDTDNNGDETHNSMVRRSRVSGVSGK